MNERERFPTMVERRDVHRPASWLAVPAGTALPQLFACFGASNMADIKRAIDADAWPVEQPSHSGFLDAAYTAFACAEKGHATNAEERSLNSSGFFEDLTKPTEVADFPWPDPLGSIDPSDCIAAVEALPGDYAKPGAVWSAHFQDACAAFGMEADWRFAVTWASRIFSFAERPLMFQVAVRDSNAFPLQGWSSRPPARPFCRTSPPSNIAAHFRTVHEL